MIKITGLSKSYGKFEAVKDLSLEIAPCELIGFIGPNGAGKTTTFKCLATLSKPTRGSIIMDGIDTAKKPSVIRNFIGFLPEENPLINELNVLEYLTFRFKLKGKRGWPPSECIQTCGLEDVQKRVIGNLSKGFRQRVGIAEALLGTPKILLLDEPINGLDPEQIINIRTLLSRITKTHTIIVSSHILSELELVCDKYIIISRGRLRAFGTQDEIISKSAYKNRVLLEISPLSDQVIAKIKSLDLVEKVEVSGEASSQITVYPRNNNTDLRPELNRVLRDFETSILRLEMITPSLEHLYMELTRE